MAGDWIKMRVGLRDDPAVVCMAVKLDCDEDLVVGKLHRLWAWADQHTVDGTITGITAAWVDRYVGMTGLAAAMQAVAWLSVTDEGITFPRFDRHNGESAKKRAENTSRQKASRESRDKRHAKRATDVTKQDDKSATREEKRREEKNPEKASGVFAKLTKEILESNSLLRAWFVEQASAKRPVCESTYFNWSRVLQAAEHALESGDNPVAMFATNVGSGHWERGTNAADDRAKSRLKDWEKAARAGPATVPFNVADHIPNLCSTASEAGNE